MLVAIWGCSMASAHAQSNNNTNNTNKTNNTNNTNNTALAACVRAADQKYKDTWDTLCTCSGKGLRCDEFVGSPRDREFSQLRIEEMTLCSKLYGR